MKEETKNALSDDELKEVSGGVEMPETKKYQAFVAQGGSVIPGLIRDMFAQ